MKRCLACASEFSGERWHCPQCGWGPEQAAYPKFPMLDGEGFDEEFFEILEEVEDSSFWFRARNDLIIWALTKYAPSARSLLEVGCGTGYVLAGVNRAFPQQKLTGLELFTAGLDVARSRVPAAELLQGDARRLPFTEEFDVACAFDVIEHIDEDELVLREMRRTLKPGGLALVSVPQHPRLWSAADAAAQHKRRYTRDELLERAREAGLEIVHATSFVSLLAPLLYASRIRTRDEAAHDLRSEFPSGRLLNGALGGAMSVERALIQRGVSFPIGGSLLMIARRPVTP